MNSCRRTAAASLTFPPFCLLRIDRSFQTDARAEPARPDSGTASGASREYTSLGVLVFLLESAPRGGEEGLFQVLGVVALVQRLDGLEAEQPAAVEDPDAVGEQLGL